MADLKAPPPPQPIPEGTVFVKNPSGTIHDVNEDDPRTASAVEQAKKAHNGWSLASSKEIAAYCEANNLVSPNKSKKGQTEVVEEAAKIEEPQGEESPATAGDEAPPEQPAKKVRGRRSKK